MKPIYTVLIFCLIACSPYKKVTVTASDRLTKAWQGSTEQVINKAYGQYKEKNTLTDGYLLRFDYSYLLPATIKKEQNIHVQASSQQSSPMLPPPTNPHAGNRSPDDSVIRRLDFYFDKFNHVQTVLATGFPDSVYYVKRK